MTIKTTIENAGKAVLGAFSPGTAQADILDTLKEEHDEVKKLLGRLVDSDTARERKSLVAQVKKALVPHTKAEEKVVYDPIIALRDKDAKIDGAEGYFEHALAGEMLAKLGKMTKPLSPEFSAAAKVLKELVTHHIDEEERNIWGQVKENFSGEDRAAMNRAFLAAKKKVKV